MDKRRNWLIDAYLSLGNALCELSTGGQEISDQLNAVMKNIQKHVELSDNKLTQFLLKYYFNQRLFGKALKVLLKQLEDKQSSQQQEFDEKLLQVGFDDENEKDRSICLIELVSGLSKNQCPTSDRLSGENSCGQISTKLPSVLTCECFIAQEKTLTKD